MTTWQRRRNRLNHDWLKITFIIQLGALLNFATSKADADDDLIEACRDAVREWVEHRLESRELIDAFGSAESPKALFSIPPLSNCDEDTKSWLPDLIHRHWLTSHPVETWIEDALSAWKDADEQTRKLECALDQPEQRADVLAALVNEVRHSVSSLSDAISQFPSRQLI
jgi:hypothetical protein